jgi:hypothetical protein
MSWNVKYGLFCAGVVVVLVLAVWMAVWLQGTVAVG